MPGRILNVSEDGAPSAPSATTLPFPLEELAWKCTKNALAVSHYLSSQNLPQPSNDIDGPSRTLPQGSPEWVQKSRQGLMDAALQLFQLAAGPSEFVPNLAPGVQYSACLAWLLHYDIFHLVPLSGSITYPDLATAALKKLPGSTEIPSHRLKSILRMSMTSGLFHELHPNQISHSATSALLARDPDVHAWASYFSTRSAPTALSMLAAHDRFTPSTVAKSETAYNIAFTTPLPFFDHLATDPAGTAEFAGYMRNVTTSDAVDLKHLIAGYPWASLGTALVVDIGGSTGSAALALAKEFPPLSLVVQDLPKNAQAGADLIATTPFASRITFQPHDFTTPQPIPNAKIYLLRMILHDWPDHIAITILRNLLPPLRQSPGAKIVIMDSLLPAPGTVPKAVERIVRVRDLTMMQVFNSQERDLEQWKGLVAAADAGLKVLRVVQPFGSAMAVLEVGFEEEAVVEGGGVVEDGEVVDGEWDISG